MVQQFHITLPAYPKGFHLITNEILGLLPGLPTAGLLHLFIHHTSAGLSVNENADQTVRHDLDRSFDQLAPENQPFYRHTVEGPDDMPAHVKSVLVGSSVSIPITNSKLGFGTWQGIFLCEFREQATSRKLTLTLIS